MSSRVPSTIFVIGGTGAQGLPVIRALVADGKYAVRALSRDPESRRAIELSTLGNVSIVKGTFADEAVLRDGLRTAGRAAVSGMRSTLGQSRHNGDGNGVFCMLEDRGCRIRKPMAR
ncbi:NmrA family NAD(P)-binding protein [Burkholderia cenocepacia]|uniref:NmrA family NAD(P)-binding protein n=1 Tax=Burkholderia cenocepacia TaxID=95486 RepID=UPI00396AF205